MKTKTTAMGMIAVALVAFTVAPSAQADAFSSPGTEESVDVNSNLYCPGGHNPDAEIQVCFRISVNPDTVQAVRVNGNPDTVEFCVNNICIDVPEIDDLVMPGGYVVLTADVDLVVVIDGKEIVHKVCQVVSSCDRIVAVLTDGGAVDGFGFAKDDTVYVVDNFL